MGPNGESVTQSEYHAARASGKVILAFVQEAEMEDQQKAFRQEVENFSTGFFRGSFRSPEELKDGIVKSLRQLNQAQQAIPQEEFSSKINHAVSEVAGYSSARTPVLCLAFLPQPMRGMDIVSVEGRLDSIFSLLCQNGVMTMREGYSPECKRDWTGIKTKDASVAFFSDGMILLLLSPVVRSDNYFSGSFASPSRIKGLAAAAFPLVEATSCWAHVSLSGMDHVVVREPPEGNVTSMTMRMYGDKEAAFDQLFIPLTQDAYARWIEQCLKRFERIFAL